MVHQHSSLHHLWRYYFSRYCIIHTYIFPFYVVKIITIYADYSAKIVVKPSGTTKRVCYSVAYQQRRCLYNVSRLHYFEFRENIF